MSDVTNLPAPPTTTPTPGKANNGGRTVGAIVSAGSILGLILSVFLAPPAVVLASMLVAFGILVASTRLLPTGWQTVVTIAAALLIIGAGAVARFQPAVFGTGKTIIKVVDQPSATPRTEAARPLPEVTVVDPAPNSQSPASGCLHVRFKVANDATGWAFALADKSPSDIRYYFEGQVDRDPTSGLYEGSVTIGGPADAGRPVTVLVVVIPTSWETYLKGTRDEANATWWSSVGLPPESKIRAAFTAIRDASKVLC